MLKTKLAPEFTSTHARVMNVTVRIVSVYVIVSVTGTAAYMHVEETTVYILKLIYNSVTVLK